ncbi:MAG: prolipoprotein diacylglyceryl transferase [Bacteroidota bacterium]
MAQEFINWNPNPEIINFFGISIRYYGLLFVSGLIISYFILKRIFENEHIPIEALEKLATYSILGILIGARLIHCIFYDPTYYLNNPIEIFLPIQILPGGEIEFTGYRGLASHGGVLGLIIALILYSKKTKQSIIKTIDLIAIVAPIGGFFIRMANLMNSEIIGKPSTLPWSFIFERVDYIPRHPTQIYEGLSYLLISFILFRLYKLKEYRKGYLFGMSLILVFTARFFIEFVKEHQVDYESQMILDMGQILSIPYILIGIGFVISSIKHSKN